MSLGVNASEASRALAWGACLNVRDLGGLSTADGRRVRHGALVRSDQLCRLDDGGRDALVAHGVRTVIDLRTPAEAEKDPDPTWHEQGVDYALVPIEAGTVQRSLVTEIDSIQQGRRPNECAQ